MSDEPQLPMLVGEAPSKGGDRYYHFPLSGRPARVLCTLAGIPPQEEGSTYGRWTWALYERFDCRNLIRRYADATPWSAPLARTAATELLAEERPRVVVCLGRKVQAAMADALDFRAARLRGKQDDGWGGGLFGSFGVWAAPSMIRTPVAGEELEYAPWLVTIPHPSGLNRLLNDPAHRERCGEVLRRAMEL